MQPPTHEGFAECGRAEVAGLGPCNQHLILLQWIFHFSVFYSYLLSCAVFSALFCLAEVLLFIHLVFCEREGQILLARSWGRVTRICAGVPTFVCLTTSPAACLSLLLSAASLIHHLLFSKHGHP